MRESVRVTQGKAYRFHILVAYGERDCSCFIRESVERTPATNRPHRTLHRCGLSRLSFCLRGNTQFACGIILTACRGSCADLIVRSPQCGAYAFCVCGPQVRAISHFGSFTHVVTVQRGQNLRRNRMRSCAAAVRCGSLRPRR